MKMTKKSIKCDVKEIKIPDSAVNHAFSGNGASAKASACSAGFKPDGAINGSRSIEGWGTGNGWQAPSPVWHPNWWGEWLEVDFSSVKTIDTILIYAYPALVRGRFWRGLRDFQIQYLDSTGDWITLRTVMGNEEDCIVTRFKAISTGSIRVWVTRNHYPEEKGFETGFTPINESPRILEVEAYRLEDREIWHRREITLDVEEGAKGNIGVLADKGFSEAVSSPDGIAEILRTEGYGVTFLDAEQLCEPHILNKQNFDILIHPYGKYVPLGINLFEFLQEGGHIITLGGHAFTRAKQRIDGVWRDTGIDPEITASTGRYNDAIRPYREQLGIFSIPKSRLKYVQGFKASPDQYIVDCGVKVDAPVEGVAAYGMAGELLPIDESARYAAEGRLPSINHTVREGINRNRSEEQLLFDNSENYPPLFTHPCARWIPLLNGYDAYGRDRGPVAAVLFHYEGVYRGSSWAFFGAEDCDIFRYEGMSKALTRLVEYMLLGVCIHSLEPGYVCYRQGENVKFSVIVDNCGNKAREAEIHLEIFQMGEERLGEQEISVHTETRKVNVQPGSWKKLEAVWEAGAFQGDMYRIKAVLTVDGRTVDSLENGFVVWDEKILSLGPEIEFKDNYFNFGGVPRHVLGARDSGLHLIGQPGENPLGWDRQYRTMRDCGMRVTSPIHIDWLIPGIGWGQLDRDNPIPEEIARRLDAQAQLAQKYGLIYAPGLFFVYENQAIKDPELSKIICKAVGERYKSVPGIMFYLTDDTLDHIPEVYNEFTKTCVDALNSCGRTYIVTTEFGFRQEWPDALRQGSKYLTFNSGSNFQRAVGDPVYDRLVDMRPAGKSFSYAEFVRRIPAGTPEDFYGYMIPPHLSFGMGYALAMNWKWHTTWHTIWPSDVIFPGNRVPKDHLIAYRNEALFFRRFMPVYKSPELLVVLPSTIWLENTDAVTRHMVAFLRRLMELKVDFACIDDTDLELLPAGTKALIYPIPMEMEDGAYQRILEYVRTGGNIFITGDIARRNDDLPDEASRKERLNELCGVIWKGYAYSSRTKGHSMFIDSYLPSLNVSEEMSVMKTGKYTAKPWIEFEPDRAQALVTAENGKALVTGATCGNGTVWFTPDMNPALPRTLLEEFLNRAGVGRNVISPDLPTLYCFKTDTLTGPVHTVVTFPWDRGRKEVEVTTGAGKVGLVLKDMTLGVIHVLEDKGIDAVEAQGAVTVNGEVLVDSDTHVMLSALDGKELDKSSAVLVYPIAPGKVGLRNGLLECAETGEIKDGRWYPYEPVHISNDKGFAYFDVDNLRSTALILLYRREERQDAVLMAQKALAD